MTADYYNALLLDHLKYVFKVNNFKLIIIFAIIFFHTQRLKY
jgi:hypothetical protein